VVDDIKGFSYRLDKNNVDIDTENVMLAANQIKYQGLMAGLKSEFSNLQSVCKSS
jgi:flagellar basal-body rod protein FlgB